MSAANRIALLLYLAVFVSCSVGDEISFYDVENNDHWPGLGGAVYCGQVEINKSCDVNNTVNNITKATYYCYSSDNSSSEGSGSGSGSGSEPGGGKSIDSDRGGDNVASVLMDMICTEIAYKCNCSNLTCLTNFTCMTVIPPTLTTTNNRSTSTSVYESTSSPTSTIAQSETQSATYTAESDVQTTEVQSNPGSPPSIASDTTASSSTESQLANNMLTLVLWIVLGCLIALIIVTLCAIFGVSVAHCQRYKRKKQPTALDIISKWEDTPNESSEIQLLSMKAIEDKDNASEKRSDGRAEEKGEKDDSNGKVEVKEVSKEDDITVGTFGFAEKAVKSSTSKDENPSTVTESEKKEGQSKEGESAKEEKNEKLVEVTIEKAGEVCTTSSEVNPVSDDKSSKGTDTTVPAEKDKAQELEGTKPEPVPAQIPVIGKQVADEKSLDSKHSADLAVKSPQQSDIEKPTSPSKDQAVKSETSSSSQDVLAAAEIVSKEPEPAATITKPQTEDVKTVSLASDKPPSTATATVTGGLSLFTNEDMEKALGVAATKDLGQVESTQL